ncbi:ATP-binding protein [candidate division KSB1 bacterium]|nr:ATP-binding protein [candidate division KSB1 bacterium]
MEKNFKREINALDEIFEWIAAFVTAQQVDPAAAYAVNLAVEELFTNMVKYNAGNGDDILIAIDRNGKDLVVTMIDSGGERFDVTKSAEVDVTQGLEDRQPGGLGLHLVKKMVDRLDYEYVDQQNKITLIKHLES